MSEKSKKWSGFKNAGQWLKNYFSAARERLKKVKKPKLKLPSFKLDPNNNRHTAAVLVFIAAYLVAAPYALFAYMKSTNDPEAARKILAENGYASLDVGTFDRQSRCKWNYRFSAEFNAKSSDGTAVSGAVCMKGDRSENYIFIGPKNPPSSPK